MFNKKKKEEKKQYIFSYGNIINPKATVPVFGTNFPIIASVFLKGYKLILKQAPNAKNGYHNIICQQTEIETDLIPGFLTEVPEKMLPLMDAWEGTNYQRQEVVCYTRFLEPIKCEMYISNSKQKNIK